MDVPAIKLMLVALLCRRILHQRLTLEHEDANINDKRITKRHRDPNRRRNRLFGLQWRLADENVESGCGMSNRDFKRCFRMDRECFAKLYNIVYQFLSRIHTNASQATNGSGSRVTVKTKLVCKTPTFHDFTLTPQIVNYIVLFCQAVSLRWLAGGSYHDICGLFGLGPGGFFSQKKGHFGLPSTLYMRHWLQK